MIIRRICRDNDEHKPRTHCRIARRVYLNLAKCKKKSAKKIRKTIRKLLGFVNRDLGYIDVYLEKRYELLPKESSLVETIRKVCEQQKYMYDNRTHSVDNRIVSLSRPYIRPIVRGEAKSPIELGVKLDLSIDEDGMGLIKCKLEETTYSDIEM